MPVFDQMQYQPQIVHTLTRLSESRQIPNALLFSGDESTGKKQAAVLFFKGINCLNNVPLGCTACDSCHKVDADLHPDLLFIELQKDKKKISIAQIRQIADRICNRPNEARFRMVLISNSDQMNTQAQNALLKMLEEPPENTFFILTATLQSRLLPTVLSRCRHLVFSSVTPLMIRQYLIEHHHLDEQTSHIAAHCAGADHEKALFFAGLNPTGGSINWPGFRKWLMTSLFDLMTAPAEKAISTGLLLAEHLCRLKDHFPDSMVVLRTFFRDLLIAKHHPEKIVNLDFLTNFTDIGRNRSTRIFLDWMNHWLETEKRIDANSSPRLTLDRFFLKIATSKGRFIYD